MLLLRVQVLVSNLCGLFSPTQNMFMKATYSKSLGWKMIEISPLIPQVVLITLHSVSSIRSFSTDHWKITSYRDKNYFLFLEPIFILILSNYFRTLQLSWTFFIYLTHSPPQGTHYTDLKCSLSRSILRCSKTKSSQLHLKFKPCCKTSTIHFS